MIVASEKQERWCGFCGESVVPVLLPEKRIYVNGYGEKHNYESKPKYVCPGCGRANLRMYDKASTGRALKQKKYVV